MARIAARRVEDQLGHNVPHAHLSLQTLQDAAGFGQQVQSGPHVQLSPVASERKQERV